MPDLGKNSVEVTALVIDAFEAGQFEYVLGGAISANAYGISRSTNEIDFAASLNTDQLLELRDRLGPEFQFDPQIQLEGFTRSLRNVVTFLPNHFQIELFRLDNEDKHYREQFERRCRIMLSEIGRETWLPTAEDVVIQKLRWQRRHDIDDIVNIIAVNGSRLDWNYLGEWTRTHGTQKLLRKLWKSLPNLDDLNV